MSKQDVEYALSDLETALSIISNHVVMPASGGIYPFYRDAKVTLRSARESLNKLHEHPFVEERETHEYTEPESCYCSTTNHPPCSYCTREVNES